MIKSNELRLGNLVIVNGKIVEIEATSKTVTTCKVVPANAYNNLPYNPLRQAVTPYTHVNLPYSYLDPLPITEEFFKVRGFQIHKYLKDVHLGQGYILRQENLLYFVEGWGDIIEVKYIHQLQNLYFALTGEELITNGLDSLKKSDN